MRKILFRADAAPHIGIGDLMSLMNLSCYFENYESYFIIKDYDTALKLVEKYALKNVYVIPSNIIIEEEVSYINNLVNSLSIDILFFEITERKFSDYKRLTKDVKKVVVNFDGHILNDLDIVIDWDVVANEYFDVKKYPNTKFLLGPEYVILPKSFYSEIVMKRENKLKNNRLLIALGGADEQDYTSKIIKTIIKKKLDFELNIIIGAGYQKRKELELILKESNLVYEINQNVTNMLEQYLSCDIGIGAGGLTSSELVACRTSPILIALYEHQVERCKFFAKKGWAHYLGYKNYDEGSFLNALNNPIKPKNTLVFDTSKIVESVNELFR